MDEATIQHAEQELVLLDPVLGRLIASQQLRPRTQRGAYFAALCRSIVGQQVSVAAAAAIYGRLEALTGMDPVRVAALSEDEVKAVGLSRGKAGYVRDLAGHFVSDPEVYNHLESQSDEQVIEELTAVKGIGVWTAQMFLMFTLGRPDVFAPDDVGLQKGMMKLYGWELLPPKAELVQVADKWRPWRTVACWHLWQSLDNNPDLLRDET